jgi:hypothetical protein
LISETIIPEGFKAGADRFEGPGDLTKLSDRDMERWDDFRQDLNRRAEGRPVKEEDKEIESQIGQLIQLDEAQELIETNLEEISVMQEQRHEMISEERIEDYRKLFEESIEEYLLQVM